MKYRSECSRSNSLSSPARRVTNIQWLYVAAAVIFSISSASDCFAQARHWVTCYYPGWEVGNGTNSNPPINVVNFSSMTAVVYFGFTPYPNGAIDTSDNMSSEGSNALVREAHAAGTAVIMGIGGWQTQKLFEGATRPAELDTFVRNIVKFVRKSHYDGVDIDWEPLTNSDFSAYANLTKALRAALPHPYILTAATSSGSQNLMASLSEYFDEINLMTYDLSFPSDGWVTWYNSALYDDGITVGWSKPVPACDNIIKKFTDAGVPASKLGIGAELAGAVWRGGVMMDGKGVTRPDQKWISPPSVRFDVPLYWHDGSGIMQKYYSKSDEHWDPVAKVPYLSIHAGQNSGDMFVSYDDSASIAAKAAYVKKKKLGGIILYELGWGYPGDGKYPLLEAAGNAFGKSLERLSMIHGMKKIRMSAGQRD